MEYRDTKTEHRDVFTLKAKRKRLSRAQWNEDSQSYIVNDELCRTLDVVIWAEIQLKNGTKKSAIFTVTEGGVTGFESFYVKDLIKDREPNKDMCFCAGTPGRWDSLKVEAEEWNACLAKMKELGY